MPATERIGKRDLTYSGWHRVATMRRYIGNTKAFRCGMIDIDCVEYDTQGSVPLALIETARDVGQEFKPATVMTKVAEMAGLPAFVVLYKVEDDQIVSFRRAPARDQSRWSMATPDEHAAWLWSLRDAVPIIEPVSEQLLQAVEALDRALIGWEGADQVWRVALQEPKGKRANGGRNYTTAVREAWEARELAGESLSYAKDRHHQLITAVPRQRVE